MDTPSKNTRSKAKKMTPFKSDLIKGVEPKSPFLYNSETKTKENENMDNKTNLETPNAWLKFKSVFESSQTSQKKTKQGIRLSHLDSIELRNRVIPRQTFENKKQKTLFKKVISYLKQRRTMFLLCLFLLLIPFFIQRKTVFKFDGDLKKTFSLFKENIYKIVSNVEKKQEIQEKELIKEKKRISHFEMKIKELRKELYQIKKSLINGSENITLDLVVEKVKSLIPNYLVVWKEGEDVKMSNEFVSFLKKFVSTEGSKETFEDVISEIDLLRTKISSTYKGLTKKEAIEQIKQETRSMVNTFYNTEMKEMVDQLIKKELKNRERKYSIDYASKANGGSIVKKFTTKKYSSVGSILSFLDVGVRGKDPEVSLIEDMSVGNCWSFNGEEGVLTIKLSRKILVKEFELKHIPWSISPYRAKSSIKDFSVYGYNYEDLNYQNGFELFSGTYDINGEASQIFNTFNTDREFEFISLKIKNNYGQDFTCVYKVGVFGIPKEVSDQIE